MENRITSSHVSGRGDFGYSDLAHGDRISKGSSLPKIYWEFDNFQHELTSFHHAENIKCPKMIELEDLKFVEYLIQMTFAINSFLYGAGEEVWTDNYMFDSEAQEWMMNRIEYFKQKECNLLGVDKVSSEFIIPEGAINKLRLCVRSVESAFWSFRDDRTSCFVDAFEEVVINLDKTGESFDKIYELIKSYEKSRARFLQNGSFLNKLSSYFYWMMRSFHISNSNSFQGFKTWISKAPKFSEFVSS